MKYLIRDTEEHTLGEINEYFASELKKTNLKKADIQVEDSLKKKIAMVELDRIFDENGMSDFYEMDTYGIRLKHTGNAIEFSNNEIKERFNHAYDCILTGIKEIAPHGLTVESIISQLNDMDVDGETMEYIIDKVHMSEQMLKQLKVSLKD